ncbi:MAG TPA: Rho termination factor N-terminal domain-containing protein, partial [Acidimicrobiales bacterium]|nr:Rho termination factor N-terminal domain-containing protein [Acidimicrobiales bacterium]
MHMSDEQQLERSVLERKERDELHAIAEAMGLKPASRTRKADLIDEILRVTGVVTGSDNGSAPADSGNGDTPAADAERPRRG